MGVASPMRHCRELLEGLTPNEPVPAPWMGEGKMAEMAPFRQAKAPFYRVWSRVHEHKPLGCLLLRRPTYWRPRARKNGGRHFWTRTTWPYALLARVAVNGSVSARFYATIGLG